MPAVTLERNSPGPGFFGKLPDRGDFITRWLPKRFVDTWDRWLQACIATSQAQLGPAWEDSYMTSPIWRFALPGALVGGQEGAPEGTASGPVAGVLMPSVDRVGRCYPLTFAAMTSAQPVAALPLQKAWYDRLEQTALSALDDDTRLEGLEAAVQEIGLPPGAEAEGSNVSMSGQDFGGAGDTALRFGVAAGQPDYAGLLDHLLGQRVGSYSLWWTAGSDRVAPSTLVFGGLPQAASFATLLAGERQEAAPVYSAPAPSNRDPSDRVRSDRDPSEAAFSAPEVKDDIDDLLA